MGRKIIDDYCLYYLNDLFGIKLISTEHKNGSNEQINVVQT